MKKRVYILLFFLSSIGLNAQSAFHNLAVKKPQLPSSYSFQYTGGIQKFIVPNRVTSIQVSAIGAKGGSGARGQAGGGGANITTNLNVTPGQVLYIVVGGDPGQSTTPAYGFGGSGGAGTYYGGAGGGLSGVFTSSSPANANALVVAGGGGGGAGNALDFNYSGGNAGNNGTGTASNGNEPTNSYVVNGRYQYGYAATTSGPGQAGEAYDVTPVTLGSNGNDISGGAAGSDNGIASWHGAGGGGAGWFGGGGGAGGGAATGGGAGGSTKSSSGQHSFGTLNTTGNGSVTITTLSNSGLVLHLDAGNSASYSGSGTTWNDLSGNGSHVTLTSTDYSAANGGSIVFNGTSSYANFNANIGSTNAITVDMWVKTNSLNAPNGAMYFGFSSYNAWTYNGNLGFNTASSDQYGFLSNRVSSLGIQGSWKHLVFVMYAGSKTNNKIYVNTQSQTMSQMAGSFSDTNATFNSGTGKISGWAFPGQSSSWLINMNVASFKIYNRELSQQEITNNFNTGKTRFYAENDGLSSTTASTSANQIKLDYPNSTDGFYWIKNPNINSGNPFRIYADMTTDGGGWTLIMKNSSNLGWNYANAISLNTSNPYTTNSDITSTSTANYSIVGWADYIKRSPSGFQYMIDATNRRGYGGIWTAEGNYSFVKTDNTQTNVTINTKFNTWSYAANNMGLSQRMPWYSNTAGSGFGLLTMCDGTGNWWGTLISSSGGFTPAPWISDAGTGGNANQNPGIIWYWVR